MLGYITYKYLITMKLETCMKNEYFQLLPAPMTLEFRKKYNVGSEDFFKLYDLEGKDLQPELWFRIGGLTNIKNLEKSINSYFCILCYKKELYSDSITKDPKRKTHLGGSWVIIDKFGNIRLNAQLMNSPCLYSIGVESERTNENGVVYSIKDKFYNIETNEYYGSSSKSIVSNNHIIIDTKYDYILRNENKQRGVLKINKKDGKSEFID